MVFASNVSGRGCDIGRTISLDKLWGNAMYGCALSKLAMCDGGRRGGCRVGGLAWSGGQNQTRKNIEIF